MSANDFLHDALDAALPVLETEPDATYVVVACNDYERTITTGTVSVSKSAAAAAQTRLSNQGHRAYLAVRFDGHDYLLARFDGADTYYLNRPAREAVMA